MKNSYKINIDKNNFLAILTAFLIGSPFTYKLFNLYNLYAFEIPVLIILSIMILLNSYIFKYLVKILKTFWFQMVFFILFLLFIIGILYTKNIVYVYADFRGNLIFWLSFFILFYDYVDSNGIIKNFIYKLSIYSTLLWTIYAVYLIITNRILDTSKNGYPIFMCILGIYLSLIYKKNFILLFFIMSSILLAFTSFYRNIIIVTILSLIVVIFVYIKNIKNYFHFIYNKDSVKTVILLLLLLLILNKPIKNYYFKIIQTDSFKVHVIDKSADLFNYFQNKGNLNSSDNIRYMYYYYILNDPKDFILPHGLGYRFYYGYMDKYIFGISRYANSIDSAYFYIDFHYGLIIFVLLIIIFIYLFIKSLVISKNKFLLLIGILMILFTFSVSGACFAVMQRGIWEGGFLGFILSKSFNTNKI